MQCPECGYISFKISKTCGACGFKFKKAKNLPALTGKESFYIFGGPPEVKKEEALEENSPENVAVLEKEEPESFIDPETGDFNLDLPEIQEGEIEEAQIPTDQEVSEFEPLEFDPNADIDLGEVEVEGLGLEPFQVTEEAKSTEPVEETSEEAIILDESGESPSLEPVLEITDPEEPTLSIEEPALEITEPEPIASEDEDVLEIPDPAEEPALTIDEPTLEITEPTLSEEEPVLEIPDLAGGPALTIDEPMLEITEPETAQSEDEPVLEISDPSEEPALTIDEPMLEINDAEPSPSEGESPELDLGDNEIKLDLGYEPPPSNDPDPSELASQLEEIDLNLEIDDSEVPLSTSNNEVPEIEIEDLGLELESPDDSEEEKPQS